jgi:hypothetical protein
VPTFHARESLSLSAKGAQLTVETYADYPKTLNEHKSEKTRSPLDWKPRDALVSLLRMIDEGKVKPDSVVIAYKENGSADDADDRSADIFHNGFLVAGCSALEAMGLCVATSQDIWEAANQ